MHCQLTSICNLPYRNTVFQENRIHFVENYFCRSCSLSRCCTHIQKFMLYPAIAEDMNCHGVHFLQLLLEPSMDKLKGPNFILAMSYLDKMAGVLHSECKSFSFWQSYMPLLFPNLGKYLLEGDSSGQQKQGARCASPLLQSF